MADKYGYKVEDVEMQPIEEFKAWEHGLPDGHRIVVVELPAQPPSHAVDSGFDVREITVPSTSGSLWMTVRRGEHAELVASATFAADDRVVRCNLVNVEKTYRKQGVAKYLYHLASERFNAPVVPSDVLLGDGELFWGKKKAIDCDNLPGGIDQ